MSVNWQKRLQPWLNGVTKNNGAEHVGYCPLHEEPGVSKTPSASFNFSPNKKTYIHFGVDPPCQGRLWQLWQQMQERGIVAQDNVRDIGSAPSKREANGDLPTDEILDQWTARLLANDRQLKRLQDQRGLEVQTIQDYELGWDGERYTIPIRNRAGELVNVRRYMPGMRNGKMKNIAGFGGATLYGLDVLDDEWCVLTEGEMDKLIGRQHGFPTICTTAGSNTWQGAWSAQFKGKRVYIVYDVDAAGVSGAKKVAVSMARAGATVHIVQLPLTVKGSDLTDYFVNQGYTAKSFQELLDETPPFTGVAAPTSPRTAEPMKVDLLASMAGANVDKPIEIVATVMGKATQPYALPRRVSLDCTQDWDNSKCSKCPMDIMHGGQHEFTVDSHSELLLELVDKSKDQRVQQVLASQGIPPTCKRVETTVLEQQVVEQLFLVPSVDEDQSGERVERVVYNVGPHDTTVNQTVRMVGVSTPSPANAQLVMQTWECEPTRTSLDRFTMDDVLMKELSVFQPDEGQRPLAKMAAIANDLAANVTHIYGRTDLHIAYDVVWHSLLDFKFRGAYMGKGWLELLVMGDTRTGKSEAAGRLRKHYQAGVLTSCEGATLAGLVGGAQSVNNRWVITWGTIPLQDRRLVVLDEASGLAGKNILENMSEIRSSGTAKVTKIVSSETHARTRLIWISNPVDGRRINEMPRGAIDAIGDLVANPEDIARFDLAMVAASDDVDSKLINAAKPPKVPHVYTTELCAALVLWAWSRRSDQVRWDLGAQRLCLVLAEKMGGEYVPDPPLVQTENARVKLARIAVAIAARLFSHDGDGENVLVTKQHVYAARSLMRRLYGAPSFGYEAYSTKELRAQAVAETGKRECWGWLKQNPMAKAALLAVVNDKEFRVRDLEEFGGLPRDSAQIAIGDLLRMHMIRRGHRGYIRMEAPLVQLLRKLEGR